MHCNGLQCRQLIQDQLPERKGQLYSTYGPGGTIPLIPEAQSGSPPLSIQTLDTSDGSGQYVQIFNGNSVAVDVSGYKLQGSTSMTLQPGQYDIRYNVSSCSAVLKLATEVLLLTMQDDYKPCIVGLSGARMLSQILLHSCVGMCRCLVSIY